MRQRWIVRLAVALALVAVPATGFAQVDAYKGKKRGQRMEQVRALFLEQLGEELALDESTTEKMSQSSKRFRDQSRALRHEHKALKTKLKDAVDSEASETEIEAIFSEAQAIRDKGRQLRADHQTEMHQILGTRGYAKYVIFKQKFRKDVRKKMHWRRGHRKGSQSHQPNALHKSWG